MAQLREASPLAHIFLPGEASLTDVLRSAKTARENSGQRQWLHPHAHGVLCSAACGPLEDETGGLP